MSLIFTPSPHMPRHIVIYRRNNTERSFLMLINNDRSLCRFPGDRCATSRVCFENNSRYLSLVRRRRWAYRFVSLALPAHGALMHSKCLLDVHPARDSTHYGRQQRLKVRPRSFVGMFLRRRDTLFALDDYDESDIMNRKRSVVG